MGEDSQINEYLDQTGILKSIIAKEYFNPKNNKDVLEQFIPNYLHDQVIKDNAPILWPTSALTNFIHLTQKPDEIRHIKPFRVIKKIITSTFRVNLFLDLKFFPPEVGQITLVCMILSKRLKPQWAHDY